MAWVSALPLAKLLKCLTGLLEREKQERAGSALASPLVF